MKKKIALLLAGIMMLACVGCTNTSGDKMILTPPELDPDYVAPVEVLDPEVIPEEDDGIYLKDIFAEHGMKVGTCLSPSMVSNTVYSSLVLEQFNSVTMENAMKPDYIFNKKESKNSGDLVVEINSDMKKMLDFAKDNGLAVRGHTFVWYSQTPAWIFHEDFDLTAPLASREVMLDRMESYIRQMFELLEKNGYSELFYAYDIVNEAWMEDGTMRTENNLWYKTVGEDYIWYAFYYANKYAPEYIDLYYNDYNEQYKTFTLYDFVQTLVDEDGNYLIDGIGLQAHLYTGDDLTSYFTTVDKLAETGLKIQLTELDVCLGSWQNPKQPTDDNLKAQGRYYYNLINGIFERVDNGTISSDALTFWGFNDSLSWRKEYSPLLFDSNKEPKYAFYGAAQVKDLAGF